MRTNSGKLQKIKQTKKKQTKRIQVTIDVSLLAWIDSIVKKGIFRTRSHGVTYCVHFTKNEPKNKKRLLG